MAAGRLDDFDPDLAFDRDEQQTVLHQGRSQCPAAPYSLTHLRLDYYSSIPDRTAASLTVLRHLDIGTGYKGKLDPSLLPCLGQLTHLRLQVRVAPGEGTAYMDTWLHALPQATQLQHLQLSFKWTGDLPQGIPVVSLQQCAALTASSHLTCLDISGVQLPDDCGSSMFGKELPQLRVCRFGMEGNSYYYKRSPGRTLATPRVRQPCVFGRVEGFRSLAFNCPNLCELDIAAAVGGDVDLQPLQSLTCLTSLVVGGIWVHDASAAALSKISGLRRLVISYTAPSVWDGFERERGRFMLEGLRSLMHLTSLHTLSITTNTCLYEHTQYRTRNVYFSKEMATLHAPGPSSSAWDDAKMQRALRECPGWTALEVKYLQFELEGHNGYAAALEGRFAAAQGQMRGNHQRIADQQQQLMAQQQHTAALQQQLWHTQQQVWHMQQQQQQMGQQAQPWSGPGGHGRW